MKLEFASRFCLRELVQAHFGLGGGLFADTTFCCLRTSRDELGLRHSIHSAHSAAKMAPKKAPAPRQENVQLGPQAREGK